MLLMTTVWQPNGKGNKEGCTREYGTNILEHGAFWCTLEERLEFVDLCS